MSGGRRGNWSRIARAFDQSGGRVTSDLRFVEAIKGCAEEQM